MSFLVRPRLTFDDWLASERERIEGRTEHVRGEVFAMAGGSREHIMPTLKLLSIHLITFLALAVSPPAAVLAQPILQGSYVNNGGTYGPREPITVGARLMNTGDTAFKGQLIDVVFNIEPPPFYEIVELRPYVEIDPNEFFDFVPFKLTPFQAASPGVWNLDEFSSFRTLAPAPPADIPVQFGELRWTVVPAPAPLALFAAAPFVLIVLRWGSIRGAMGSPFR